MLLILSGQEYAKETSIACSRKCVPQNPFASTSCTRTQNLQILHARLPSAHVLDSTRLMPTPDPSEGVPTANEWTHRTMASSALARSRSFCFSFSACSRRAASRALARLRDSTSHLLFSASSRCRAVCTVSQQYQSGRGTSRVEL